MSGKAPNFKSVVVYDEFKYFSQAAPSVSSQPQPINSGNKKQ